MPTSSDTLIMRPFRQIFVLLSWCTGTFGIIFAPRAMQTESNLLRLTSSCFHLHKTTPTNMSRRGALTMSLKKEQEEDDKDVYLSSTKLTREQVVVGGWAVLLGSALLGAKDEQGSYRARKRDLFGSISGEGADEIRNILEVGVGGNPNVGGFSNLEYYRKGQNIVGVDPALSGEPSEDLGRAEEKAKKLGLTLTAMGGVAEELPFDSGSFDAVVSTLVFCSVRDPAAALREVSRVLRPGGKFLFVEHVHAPEEGLSILGLRQQQELLDPLQQILAEGCHLTRETDQLIRDSSGGPSSSRLFSRIERIEDVRVNSMWPVSQQVFGVVVK